jgi:hypothetical protein
MANAVAFIDEGLWRKDKEFQQLSRSAQCMYCQVLSQKDLDTAGVLTLHLDLLAKACKELTTEQIVVDLAELEQGRFLFVDYDTDELLVRSYVRRVSAVGMPKNRAWLSVPKNARLVASEKLRHELAVELRRLRRKEAIELADEIDPLPTPLEPPPDPLGTPSRNGTPSEPPSNPHSQVPVPVPVSPSVVGSVGVQRARPECPRHEADSDDNCRMCMRRRLWDEEHADAVEADELEQRRQRRETRDAAIKACPLCDEDGWLNTDKSIACTHRVADHG